MGEALGEWIEKKTKNERIIRQNHGEKWKAKDRHSRHRGRQQAP